MTEPSTQLLVPGARFHERYEIVDEIGTGSYGRVYRARLLSTEQDVALKILRLREGDAPEHVETQRRRFRREMRLCARLSHPHVVRLLDSGQYGDGALYAVFEYVDGMTLRELLDAEGRLAPAEAVHLMTQVLDALACAHREGIVHRDLKPENVMVTHSGLRRNATVLDFGLGGFAAGALEAEGARLTGSRDLMGTPAYAAPEQLRGEAVTPSADLYSWGLVLLECLTGEPAVAARTAHDAIVKQLGPEPVPVPTWLREQRLGRLLVAVTAKEASARDVSEHALLKALEAISRDPGPTREGAPHRLPIAEGERRQVTVLACSTTVRREDGGPIDLEDMDQAMQVQQQLYEDIVRQSGHTLVPGSAGEVHVIFGYPRAHEDDARRAVRAALRIVTQSRAQAATLRATRGLTVAAHVGLHSGVGILRARRHGDGEPVVEVVGAPVVLAAQLADRAAGDEVLASAETRALLREEMTCVLVGEAVVPDRGTTTCVFRVVEERGSSAFESSVRNDETPLVGRAGELGQLVALWERAVAGGLGIALLQGEAGIGKSRLVRELRRRVPPDACISCRCIPEGCDTPLHPIATWLGALTLPLEALLAEHGFDVAATLPLLADLLPAPQDAGATPLRLPPERHKDRTLRTVASLIVRMAKRRPTMFVLEDLHWADPTTVELIAALLEEARAAHLPAADAARGLLLLFSTRPEYVAGWATGDVTVLPLGRLSRGDVAAIVEASLRPEEPLPPRTLDDVVERTDGIPLFVEELAHALGSAERTIPGTLRELLTTRLDGLSRSAYETAQVAAAIGREVPYPLLRAAAARDEWVLRQDLMELVDARLLLVRRGSGQEAYVFRHTLMRDAAYESMVRSTRQRVHRAIAEGLRQDQPEVRDAQPERVAHHLEEAGDLPAAADHWLRAGDRDFRRAAYAEATVHLERALAALDKLPATLERGRQQIEALTVLGTVFLCSGGHAHPRVHESFARARELAAAHGLEPSLKVVAHIAAVHIIQGDRDAMQAFLPVCERLLDSPDPVAELTGVTATALAAFWRGDHRRARGLLERGLPIYGTDKFHEFFEAYGWDGGIYVPLYFLWNSTIMDADRDAAERALAIAARSEDPQAPALVNVFAMAAAHARGDVESARRFAELAIAVSQDQRFFGLLLLGMCGRGLALVCAGRAAEGVSELQSALAMMDAGGARSPWAYYRTYLAEAYLLTGEVDAGLRITGEDLARCEHQLARVHEPALLRIEGELLLRAGDRAAAGARLRAAVALAAERGARLWERRAAASLAALGADEGR